MSSERSDNAEPVCRAADVPPGTRKIVRYRGSDVGIFNVGGRYFAVRNYCPHQGAPVCLGRVGGTMAESRPHEYIYMDGPVLVCPWHQWEFDLATGACLTDARARVKIYDVVVEGDKIIVQNPPGIPHDEREAN